MNESVFPYFKRVIANRRDVNDEFVDVLYENLYASQKGDIARINEETGQIEHVYSCGPGSSGYPQLRACSSNVRIKDWSGGSPTPPPPSPSGRLNHRVHRIVANTFLRNSDSINNTQVDHIDGNKMNHDINNLEFVSPSQNTRKFYRDNPDFKVTNQRKLTDDDVRHIRNSNMSNSKLADQYGVSRYAISKCRNGKSYTNVK